MLFALLHALKSLCFAVSLVSSTCHSSSVCVFRLPFFVTELHLRLMATKQLVHISSFPDHLLLYIFSFLDSGDLSRATLVGLKWKSYAFTCSMAFFPFPFELRISFLSLQSHPFTRCNCVPYLAFPLVSVGSDDQLWRMLYARRWNGRRFSRAGLGKPLLPWRRLFRDR